MHGLQSPGSSILVQIAVFYSIFIALLVSPVAASIEASSSRDSTCSLQDLSLESLRNLDVQELASCTPPLPTVGSIISALARNPTPSQWPSILQQEVCRPLSCTSEALNAICTLTAENCAFIEGEMNGAIESTFSNNFILRQLGVDPPQIPEACFERCFELASRNGSPGMLIPWLTILSSLSVALLLS